MAITVSQAITDGAFYTMGSTDASNTFYGTSYAETFIFLGKSKNPWYGTNDLSGDFTANVSDGDTISIDSWDSPKAFDLSIKYQGNNIILTNTFSTGAQHWNPSLNSGVGGYENYSGVGTYSLMGLKNGETVQVKLGFLVDAPRLTNVIAISAVGEDFFYNYVENDTAIVTVTDTGNAFTYGGYEYGQHLISSTSAFIGLFNNSDHPVNNTDNVLNETMFYADENTTTKALAFVADDTTTAISLTLNQVYDSVSGGLVNDGTVTFTQAGVNAFVKTVNTANTIDTFTPTNAKATTHVNLTDITSVSVDFSQVLEPTFITKLNPTTVVSIVGATGDDTIYGSAKADILNGGAGTDTYVISATGQTGNAPTTWTANAGGSTISTTGMDIITMSADKLDLSAIASTLASVTPISSLITTATAFTAAGTGTTAAQSFKGSYMAGTNLFTSNASGTDTLLVYDNNGSATGGTLEAIVLVGATSISSVSSGVFTTV